MKNNFIYLPIVLSILSGCFGGENETDVLTEKVYQSQEFLFSMNVPATFIKLPEEQLPRDVLLSYLDILQKQDSFTPNISLMKEFREYSDMDILIFATGYIEKTKKIVKDYELINEINIDILGKTTKYHVFKATKDGKKYKFIQTFFDGNNDFVIIFTGVMSVESNGIEDDKYLNVIKSIKKI